MDPELFTASLPLASYLLCPICGRVLRDPVLHTTCGHSFCSGCLLAGDAAAGTCPKDGESVSDASNIIPNLTLKDGLCRLRLRCLYRYGLAVDLTASANVGQPLTVDSLLPLLSRPLQIDSDGCDAELTLGELECHLALCPHRWEFCATCAKATRANQVLAVSGREQSLLAAGRLICAVCFAASDRAVNTTGSSAAYGHNLAASNHDPTDGEAASASAAPADADQSQPAMSRDQLRTMLANQRRLDEAVSALSGRLSALSAHLNQRLEALESSIVGGCGVQMRPAAPPLQDAGLRESTVSSVLSELDAGQRPQPQLVHQQQQQQQQQQPAEWTMPFSLTCTGSFCGHAAPIVHLAIVPGGPDASSAGAVLYSFGLDGEIRAWDAAAGRCRSRVVWSEGAAARLTCACVPDELEDCGGGVVGGSSPLLLAGSGSGCLARLGASSQTTEELRVVDCVPGAHAGRPVSAMCARWRLLFTSGEAEVRVWRLPDLTGLRHVTSLQRQICGLGLLPGGLQRTLLAVCRNRICLFGVSDVGGGGGCVGVVDADELHVLSFTRMLKKNFGVPYCLLATQRHIIVGTAKKGIWLFDAHLGDHVTCLGAELGAVKSLACTPSGNWLLSTTLDGAIHVWDVRGQRQVQKTHWHRGPVFSVLLLGDTVYSGSADMDIKVFKYTNLKMAPMYQQIATETRAIQPIRPL